MKTIHSILLTFFFVAPAFAQFRPNEIMTTNRVGVGKVDGITTSVDKYGTISVIGGVSSPTNGITLSQFQASIHSGSNTFNGTFAGDGSGLTNITGATGGYITTNGLLPNGLGTSNRFNFVSITNGTLSGTLDGGGTASIENLNDVGGNTGTFGTKVSGGGAALTALTLNLANGFGTVVSGSGSATSPIRAWRSMTYDAGPSSGPTNSFHQFQQPVYSSSFVGAFTGDGSSLTNIGTGSLQSNISLTTLNVTNLNFPGGIAHFQTNGVDFATISTNGLAVNTGNSNWLGGSNFITSPYVISPNVYLATLDGSTSWSTGTLYTNGPFRALLRLDVTSISTASGSANQVFMHYTNSGVGRLRQVYFPLVSGTDERSLDIDLDPGATFKMDTITSTGGSLSIQNGVLIAKP